MRFAFPLAVLLASAAARADAGAGDAWADFTTEEGALENVSTSDCETACKALESLARAAEHVCNVDPARCEEARAKVRAASDRVHAACPQCAVRTHAEAPPPTAGQPVPIVARTESAPAPAGCGGCATAPRGDGRALLGFGLLLLLAGIRRR